MRLSVQLYCYMEIVSNCKCGTCVVKIVQLEAGIISFTTSETHDQEEGGYDTSGVKAFIRGIKDLSLLTIVCFGSPIVFLSITTMKRRRLELNGDRPVEITQLSHCSIYFYSYS